MYFIFLLLCSICSQEIIGTFANEDIRKSLDTLVRQKRVISHLPNEDVPVMMKTAPYIVQIKEKSRIHCVGSIVSLHVVITISTCIRMRAPDYSVSSGSPRTDRGDRHTVIDIRRHFGNHPQRIEDGIALLTVDPPFVYGENTNRIELHTAPLLSGTLGTISGWGFNSRGIERGTKYLRYLRSIEVPILAHRECVNAYRHFNIEISDMDICTFHPRRHSGHTDGGAPLVVDGYLAGVHLWTGVPNREIDFQSPDVFAMLQHSTYNQWIRTNIHEIELQFNNHH